MSVDTLIMVAGAFTATLPFLGFPIKTDNIILVAIGIFVISLGIIVRRRGVAQRARARAHQTYVDNTPKVQGEAHETA